jgi:aminoglycoside phosphotransferase (APT) family kinase protein
LELELLKSIRPLWIALRECHDRQKLVSHVGRSLAVIHDQLRLPETLAVPLSEMWQLVGAKKAVLHGDFGIANIQVDVEDGCLAILDWSVAPWLGTHGTIGPREFDLAWFIRSLFFAPHRWDLHNRHAAGDAEVFLEGYFSQTDYSQDVETILNYVKDTAELFLHVWLEKVSVTALRRFHHKQHARRYYRYAQSDELRHKCEAILKDHNRGQTKKTN